jgi:peptidoglycan/LPS O-acetylase OafA/YrhL
MTYSSYLLHVPVQITVATLCAFAGWRIPFDQPPFFLAFLAVTLLLSYWTYELFEMPMQKRVRTQLTPARTPGLSGRVELG